MVFSESIAIKLDQNRKLVKNLEFTPPPSVLKGLTRNNRKFADLLKPPPPFKMCSRRQNSQNLESAGSHINPFATWGVPGTPLRPHIEKPP